MNANRHTISLQTQVWIGTDYRFHLCFNAHEENLGKLPIVQLHWKWWGLFVR